MLGEAITGVVDSDLGKLWDKVQTDFLVSGDVVDRLQLVRTALSKFGFDGLGSVAKLFHSSNNPATDQDEYYEGAKEEFENEGDAIQYVLYGHTHCARHDYFAGNVDGRIRMYINTGTYLPLVRGTDDGKGFAKSHQMTLAFFYRDDEDQQGRSGSGPTMDLWNGIKRKEYE